MSQSTPQSKPASSKSDSAGRNILIGGATTGFGLGAVIDVVIFHLIRQQHYLLSGYIDPDDAGGLRENMFYDGVFLLVMLLVTFVGLGLLWRTANGTSTSLSNQFLGGAVLVGAGVFNVFDGLVSHYLLGMHDVVHETAVWNPHWVIVSLCLFVAGLALMAVADTGG